MKQLLTDIQTQLTTKVTALKYVDEDWGQLDYYTQHPPAQFPAAIIDCTNAEWSNEGKLSQLGVVQITVKIADLRLTNTSGKAPASQRAQAWIIYDLLKDVHNALHGYAGSQHYSKLIRKTQRRIKRDDGMRLYEIVYTCELFESLTPPQNRTMIAVQ